MFEKIASLSNAKVKLAASLHIAKHRQKTGLFLAEGLRLSEMAAAADWGIEFGFFTPELANSTRGDKLIADLAAKTTLYEVTPEILRKTANTTTPQGILLVMKSKLASLDDLQTLAKPIYVIIDGVQDPGNAGTIIRTADAVGADAVLFLKGSVDVLSDKVVRSTMGSLFNIPVCQTITNVELLDFVTKRELTLYATALDSSAKPHFDQDFKKGCAIVFGNEGNGVSELILQHAQTTYIPMYGKAESLNVGVSAAVVLYEALRQRHSVY